MKKQGIPGVPKAGEDRRRFDAAIKENLEIVTGQRGTPIKKLDPETATTAECAAKINELISLLQQ